MTTHFTTSRIRGHGRGKFLGYPTINMAVPPDFELDDGIYAARVTLNGTRLEGAMHWGPVPSFDETNKSLEVYLLGVDDRVLRHADFSAISVEVIKKIRDVIKFDSVEKLTEEIGRDVEKVRGILRE